MDTLTTYEFYRNAYYGEVVEESAFPKWLSKATDKLMFLTFGNITQENREEYNIQIQKAVCALMDVMYQIDNAIKNANVKDESNVKSKTSGAESITFAEHETLITKVLSDTTAQNRLMQDAIAEYLADTGLMYAGV